MLTTTKYNQTTISKKISLSGVGLHTGKDVTLTFHPSEASEGWKVNVTSFPVWRPTPESEIFLEIVVWLYLVVVSI